MPYIPKARELPPYKCEGCGGWFSPSVTLTCTTRHEPGSCCHEFEVVVQRPTVVDRWLLKASTPGGW